MERSKAIAMDHKPLEALSKADIVGLFRKLNGGTSGFNHAKLRKSGCLKRLRAKYTEQQIASVMGEPVKIAQPNDLATVENALDWAFRNSYVDGKAAGEAFGRLLGLKVTVEDGGMYADRLRFSAQ